MKKLIVAVIVGLIIGVSIGVSIGLHTPKWVTEEYGMYIIHTEFLGHLYEDVADKESQHIENVHVYTVAWR